MTRLKTSEPRLNPAAETARLVLAPDEEPLFPPLPAAAAAGRRRRWPYLLATAVLLAAAGAGAAAFYLSSRGPDLAAFQQGVAGAGAVAAELQRQTDTLASPAELAAFRIGLARQQAELARLQAEAVAVPQAAPRAALISLLAGEERYLVELERLGSLEPETLLAGQLGRARELAAAGESDYQRAAGLLPSDQAVAAAADFELSPAGLERVLSERRSAWIGYEKTLAQVRQVNRQRAAQLARMQTFTGRLDGVIARYSNSRSELADWIEKVNLYGASFGEAYQVLAQQSDRRRQLRSELAALAPPTVYTGHAAALLSVIDRAIDATEAAARGISEYQYSDYYEGYSSYDQTPGWLSFEQQSNEISDAYSIALAEYEQTKSTITTRLTKKLTTPQPPKV